MNSLYPLLPPVLRPEPYHEWKSVSFYTDECIHCGKRVTQGINDHGADAEACPARQETKN